MFSYKGIDSDYKYKRGTVEAKDQLDAIGIIKETEDILIIMNMKKVSNIRSLNKIRNRLNNRLQMIENKVNQMTKKVAQKELSPDIKKEKEKKNTLTERSPILKSINKLTSKMNLTSNQITDDEMYHNLQEMFKKQEAKDNSSTSLSETKVKEVSRKTGKKINENTKEIDWKLLDVEKDPEVRKNLKIKVKEQEIIMFTRRLQIMLSSGVSLLSALILLQKTSSKNMSKVLSNVIEDIQLGSSFSEAIAKYPAQFNSTYVSLVAIGETSGSLEKVLKDIIKTKEQQQKVARKVKIASIYPTIVGIILVLMLLGASLFFIPQFNDMFADQDVPMPRFSEIVFGISEKMPYIIGTITLIVIMFNFIKKRVPEVNFLYRRYVDKLALKMPVIKKVSNASYMYSFSSTIALMLSNGIRLSDTLSLTKRTINNIYIKDQIESISELIVHGLTFSEALDEQEDFDEILVNISLTGEESGQMVFSLEQVADYYEIELIKQIDSLMELVQPISILLIAAVVAPVIIAAYLPILEISSGAGLL